MPSRPLALHALAFGMPRFAASLRPILTLSLAAGAVAFALGQGPLGLAEAALVPLPAEVRPSADAGEAVEVGALAVGGPGVDSLAAYLDDAGWLAPADVEGPLPVDLRFDDAVLPEGYRLSVAADGIAIDASAPAGHFYGLQTLRQLVEQARADGGRLGLGTVADAPRFAYRGVMLDVARHFHAPAEIERLVDLLSRYKLNVLHLHLADDQGWRLAIDSWPRLAEVGGSTQVGGGGGGFLTQAEYADLVAYAKTRHVTVVPEIDMPGHTQAALASYPELNCNPEDPAPQLYEGTEVGFSTLCIGKPVVDSFVRDVLAEVAALTPGPYLHVGGDESHATDSADYARFFAAVGPVVDVLGKRLVGWDEIATVDALDSTAVVQLWASPDNAAAAVARGQSLVVSPAKHAYLDMQYDSTSRIGLHWAAYVEVDDAYRWDPTTVIPGTDLSDGQILGVEAPLWSETVVTRADIDYLVFPRALGIAEIGWSPREGRAWAEYRERLAAQGPALRAAGVGFYQSALVDWR